MLEKLAENTVIYYSIGITQGFITETLEGLINRFMQSARVCGCEINREEVEDASTRLIADENDAVFKHEFFSHVLV